MSFAERVKLPRMPSTEPFAAPPHSFFIALETERTQALVNRDMPRIESLHAPQYELITPSGQVFTRERYLSAIAREPFYTGWELGQIAVRVSPQMTLLRYAAKLTFRSGRQIQVLHTDSHELNSGKWLAVWSQATEIKTSSASEIHQNS